MAQRFYPALLEVTTLAAQSLKHTIKLTLREAVLLSVNSGNFSSNGQVIACIGIGGDVRISAGTLSVRNVAQLVSSTGRSGNGW